MKKIICVLYIFKFPFVQILITLLHSLIEYDYFEWNAVMSVPSCHFMRKIILLCFGITCAVNTSVCFVLPFRAFIIMWCADKIVSTLFCKWMKFLNCLRINKSVIVDQLFKIPLHSNAVLYDSTSTIESMGAAGVSKIIGLLTIGCTP